MPNRGIQNAMGRTPAQAAGGMARAAGGRGNATGMAKAPEQARGAYKKGGMVAKKKAPAKKK